MRLSTAVVLAVLLLATSRAAPAAEGSSRTTMQSASGVGVPTRAVETSLSGAETSRRVIEVTGSATVSAKPDDMIVSFSVNSRAPTADQCTREQSAKTNKIVDRLKAMAGAGARIHTADFSMSPYSVPISGTATPKPAAAAQTWVFTADVTGFGKSLIMISKVIDAGVAAGATGIGGSGFGVEPQAMVAPMAPAAASGTLRSQAFLSGSAPAYVRPPEKPFISMRVMVKCAGASECVRQGSRIVDRVQRAMIDAVGNKKAVQISNFQLNELPNQQRYGYQPSPQYPTRQEFQARATVSVETRDLQKLGALIEAGISAGADQLNSVQFTLSNDATARNEAIAKAAQDAKGKAAVVAQSMGVQLGDVI
jgi:uncharacterized protein YggE